MYAQAACANANWRMATMLLKDKPDVAESVGVFANTPLHQALEARAPKVGRGLPRARVRITLSDSP